MTSPLPVIWKSLEDNRRRDTRTRELIATSVPDDRKGGLLLNNVLGIVGACLMGFTKLAESYEMLFFGRFIIGVNCGLNTSLVPMYISEIAPLNLRGGLGTVNQLAVTVGLLVSQVLGIEQILGTNEGWPVLLGLAICPAILQLLLLPVCPESPR